MAACIETEDEVVADDGEMGAVEELPADDIGEAEVTVLTCSRQGKLLNQFFIVGCQVLEKNHKLYKL